MKPTSSVSSAVNRHHCPPGLSLQLLVLFLLALTLPTQAALVAHWPLDASGNDVSGNNYNLTFQNGAVITNTAGQFIIGTGGLGGEGADGNLDGLDDRASANGGSGTAFFGIGGTSSRTVSIWVKGMAGGGAFNNFPTLVSWGNGSVPAGERYDIRMNEGAPAGRVRVEVNAGGLNAAVGTTVVNDTNWHHVMVTLFPPGSNLTNQTIYVDGKAVATVRQNNPTVNSGTTYPVALGDSSMTDEGLVLDRNLRGWLDDAAIFNDSDAGNSAAGANASAAILNGLGRLAGLGIAHLPVAQNIWATGIPASINGTTWYRRSGLAGVSGDIGGTMGGGTAYIVCDSSGNGISVAQVAPTMATNPVSQTNVVGTSATFTVAANGTQPFSYQWYFTNGPLAGATSNSFTRNPVALIHAGNYTCVITNASGSVTSAPATLTVLGNTPPFITAEPTNSTVIKGQPVTLALTASGTAPLSYRWRRNGVTVSGATTNPYNIATTAYADQGNWDVVITNNFGAITSAVAVVTILDVTAPVIANATNRTVTAAGTGGTVVSLSYVTATDDRDGAIAPVLNPASGSLFPPGSTVVSVTAADAATNSTKTYFTVTVLGTVASQTNFADNFNVSGPSDDVNYEYAAGRQSGVLAPIPYSELARNAQYGQFDIVTAVGNGSYPGTLYLNPFNPTPNNTEATLAHEFLESATFAVEVDVNPSVSTGSSDWAGIAVGAAYPHTNPDVTVTGFGILFRGNNEISTFIGGVSQPLNNFPVALPAPPFRVRIEVASSGFGNGQPAICRAFVNGVPLPLGSNSVEIVRAAGLVNNYITLSGFAQNAGSQQHTFDNLTVIALPTIFASHPDLATVVGRSNQTFTVRVPASLVATSAVSVVISNSNPAAAQMVGESGGVLTLNYSSGGPSVKTVTVAGVGAGTSVLNLSSSAPVPVGGKPVSIQVAGLPEYIYNASFEEPTISGFPGYGNIPGWSSSLTTSNGVSANVNVGGAIPNNSVSGHGKNVAFLQSISLLFAYDGTISTTITNLTPGQKYHVGFVANNQQNSQANALLGVKVDGITLLAAEIASVGASDLGYKPIGIGFTAAASSATLEISNSTFTASGLLVDDFKVNPAPKWSLSAWTGDADSDVSFTNTYSHAYNLGKATNVTLNGVLFTGVAGANPTVANQFWLGGFPTVFNNNVQNNLAGDSALLGGDFVYNGQTPKVTLLGLTPGATYRLKLFGGGFGTTSGTRVCTFFDATEGLTVDENTFGQGNGLIVNYDYTATSSSVVVDGRVLSSGTFHLWAFANQLVAAPATLNISIVTNQARLAWASSLTGYVLQSSATVDGAYTNVGGMPGTEGSELVVYQPLVGNKFYRLKK